MAERRRHRPALLLVKEGETAEPAKKAAAKKKAAVTMQAPRKVRPKSVVAAAASGDRRQLLVALGNRIAKAIDDPKTQPTALAALIRQQRDIAAEIAAIDQAGATGSSGRDWLAVIATTPDEPWDESMI
jgi:hypothetical protein